MLFSVIGMGLSSTYPELLDGFTADDTPAPILFDFVDSPHPSLFLEMEEPEPMASSIHTTGKCDRCFGFLLLGATPTSTWSTYSTHMFCRGRTSQVCLLHPTSPLHFSG